ncbi:MAG: hypothetical protein H8E68_04365 [Kiritimatiellaeota bacterium]|nr:hypothetical protein [Kiritimatiellota bacterium]
MKQLTKSSSLKWKVALVALLLQTTASVSMAAGANTNTLNSAQNWTAQTDKVGQPGNSEQALRKAIAKSLERFLDKNVRNNPEFASGINLGEYEVDEIINWIGNKPDFLPEFLSHVASGNLDTLDWWQAYEGWREWALEDSDNDGMTNGDELFALTDPDDNTSSVTLKLVKTDGADLLSWDAQSGCTYAVEGCDDLMSGEWTTLAEGLTGDQVIEWKLPATKSRAYYRVNVSR